MNIGQHDSWLSNVSNLMVSFVETLHVMSLQNIFYRFRTPPSYLSSCQRARNGAIAPSVAPSVEIHGLDWRNFQIALYSSP
jgi:hypothetical protein